MSGLAHVVMLALAWLMSSPGLQSRPRVAVFVVDASMQKHILMRRQLNWFKHFEVVDGSEVSRYQSFIDAMPQEYPNEKGFESVKGSAYHLSADGRVVESGFVTLSDRGAFEKYIDDHVASRNSTLNSGQTATREEDGDTTIIRSPSYKVSAKLDGRQLSATGKSQDLYLRFADGIMIGGQDKFAKETTNVSLSDLRPLIRKSKNKTWFLAYQPRSSSGRARSALLSMIEQLAAPGLQRRDTESDDGYKNRLTAGEAKIKLLRSLLFDVEELTAWTQWPESVGSKYRAHCVVKAHRGTELSRLIAALTPRKRSSLVREGELPNSLMSVNVSAGIPPILKSIADQHLANHKATEDSKIFGDLSLPETVNLAAEIDLRRGRPELSLALLGGSTKNVDTGAISEEVNLGKYVPGFDNLRVWFSIRQTELLKLLTVRAERRELVESTDAEWKITSQHRAQSLVRVRCNLSGLVDSAAPHHQASIELAKTLEKLLMRGVLDDKFEVRSKTPYDSLVGNALLHPNGDWTLKADIQTSRDTIKVTCEIGYELFGWLAIRQFRKFKTNQHPIR